MNPQRWRLLGNFIGGGLMTFAYAPFDWHFLMLPLLALVIFNARDTTPKQGFQLGFSFGLGWFSIGLSWIFVSIDTFGGMPLIATLAILALLYTYLALFPALAFYCWRRSAKHSSYGLLWLPIFWLLAESIRGWFLTGFPWLSLGYSQTETWMGGWAPWVGEIGIAVLLVIAAVALVQAFQQRQWIWLVVPVLFYGLGPLLQAMTPIHKTGESKSVLLVQGNIAQSLKWDADQQWPTVLKYMDLSRPHYNDHDLIIWPESAVTILEPFATDILANLDAATTQRETTLITGIIDYHRRQDDFYNSVIVLGEQQADSNDQYEYSNSNRYQKHQLLPIGEFVPFEDLLRPLAPFFNLPMSSFQRGSYQQPNLVANDVQLATAICYEMAFPEQVRANVTDDTDVLLTISNDTWFGNSHGPWQHMQIAQMRAREFGRPLLRATNNGVTAVVNAQGERQATAEQFVATTLSSQVELVTGKTLYSRLGIWAAWILALLPALSGLILHWRSQRRAKTVN